MTRINQSEIMRRVRKRDTSPELAVRKIAHSLGLRFRLQRKDLPGTLDLVFPRYRLAVQVHGCFWHRHANCKLATTPTTNQDFWLRKFSANVARDERTTLALRSLGWDVLVIWQCQIKDRDDIARRLLRATRHQIRSE